MTWVIQWDGDPQYVWGHGSREGGIYAGNHGSHLTWTTFSTGKPMEFITAQDAEDATFRMGITAVVRERRADEVDTRPEGPR